MFQERAKYGYALIDDTGRVIGIDSLKKEERYEHRFHCPFCHEEMYPTFGIKQIHHFRHIGDICQHQQYLHSIAEKIFIQEFCACRAEGLPFLLEIHSHVTCRRVCEHNNDCVCQVGQENITIVDLAAKYSIIQQEAQVPTEDSYRRPDILLMTDDGEQLWIEIWVTHETDEEKQREGFILEIHIETEADIEQIRNHRIIVTSKEDSSARLFNIDFSHDRFTTFQQNVDINNCKKYVEYITRLGPRQNNVIRPHPIVLPPKPEVIKTPERIVEKPLFDATKEEWIDLGLASGTLWAKKDQEVGISFHEAREFYEIFLPTREQVEELKESCQIKVMDKNTMVLTGPNGNTLSFNLKSRCDTYWMNNYVKRDPEFAQCFRMDNVGALRINDSNSGRLNSLRLCKAMPI